VPGPRILALGAALALGLAAMSCDLVYPEIVVENQTASHVLLRNPSFNGCVWNVVLAYGESTSSGRCLPGSDHVHFQKLDLDQAAADTGAPTWFNYQTTSVKHVGYGSFHIFEVELGDMEQDFSIPGPYGH